MQSGRAARAEGQRGTDATAGVRERGGTTFIIPDHRRNRNGRAGSGATGSEQDGTERAGPLVSGQCRADVRPSVEQQWHDSHVRADGGCQGVKHGAGRGEWAAGVR